MYYVYILQSQKDNKLYTGYTENLKRRLEEHKRGDVYTTTKFGGVTLIYYEAFTNKQDAREREIYLKTTQGKRTLKIMLKHTFKIS